MAITVKAIRRGYFGESIREEGDIFKIDNEKEFSDVWMVRRTNGKWPDEGAEALDDDDEPEGKGKAKPKGGRASDESKI